MVVSLPCCCVDPPNLNSVESLDELHCVHRKWNDAVPRRGNGNGTSERTGRETDRGREKRTRATRWNQDERQDRDWAAKETDGRSAAAIRGAACACDTTWREAEAESRAFRASFRPPFSTRADQPARGNFTSRRVSLCCVDDRGLFLILMLDTEMFKRLILTWHFLYLAIFFSNSRTFEEKKMIFYIVNFIINT